MATIKSLNVTQAVSETEKFLRTESSLSESTRTSIQTLIDAVTLFSRRLGLNSSNSSIPPSKDPRGPVKKTPRKGIKRKPGAQPGHKGTTLKRTETPDEIEELHIDRRTVPVGFYKTIGHETRQIFDIQISLFVKEYRAEIIENQNGDQYVAEFPVGVTQAAQYGNQTKASSVYLSQFQLVPLDRVCDYFEDQAGIPISKGSIANFNVEASEKLEKFEIWAKK